ncbi:DJ-1/PfpI family protein [Zooshikella marina]|uniref:DJ-1 family glyoxalase III n=1 Tax=Zooshikella ganghwensis TaxID=202772 RepID=UPI001BAFDD95|nr:DJ-1 family glyoxalase III [Zooshikella ganghwensis]MBU2704599.1 DJ-1/PfpI family protein [Zooshikella ganghwensis]
MSKRALVVIADGTEEIEAVTVIDVLRRATVDVCVASCQLTQELQIKASRGVKLVADSHIDECVDYSFDLIVLPGGMPGAEHLRDCPTLTTMLTCQQKAERWIAAICAAPAVVLSAHNLIANAKATCHPAFLQQLQAKQVVSDQTVVVDEKHALITSQGPGTAMIFALKLVEILMGEKKAQEVGQPMVLLS